MQAVPAPIVVQTRPGYDVWGFEHTWKKGLFDCCDNKRICCCVCWCYMCKAYKVYRRAGEGCLSFCWPMTLWALRTKMRTLFRIQGSLCEDCGVVQCCACCALVQMHRELDLQGL